MFGFFRNNPPLSFNDIKHKIMSIEGQVSEDECRLLFNLSQEVKEGCILEVGSYRGRSTSALGYGVIASDSGVPIYAVDPHEPFTGILGGQFGPQDRKAFFKNLLKAGVTEVVRLVNLSSEIISVNWPFEISLLWIDGDHTYEGVKRDFDCWERYVKPGKLIAFHDSVDPDLGPCKLIDEILATKSYCQVKQVDLTTVLQKKT